MPACSDAAGTQAIPWRVSTSAGPPAMTGGMVTVTQANQFAHELRRWRTARRWSQLELALRAGTTQRHLSYIEQGRSRPGRGIVLRLAESLELSLRSEEHTSELQSRPHLVCRLLLEKK